MGLDLTNMTRKEIDALNIGRRPEHEVPPMENGLRRSGSMERCEQTAARSSNASIGVDMADMTRRALLAMYARAGYVVEDNESATTIRYPKYRVN